MAKSVAGSRPGQFIPLLALMSCFSSVAYAAGPLTFGSWPTAQERINIDQQVIETQKKRQELEEAKMRNRLLQLQLDEAEAKAVERNKITEELKQSDGK